MATPMIGMNAILGLAEESTYGTPVTADHWLPILSQSLSADSDIRPVPFLGVADAQAYHNTRDVVELSRTVGGDINTCALYDDKAFLLLLKHALGGVATTGPVSTQYTHTFGCDTDGVVGLTGKAVLGSQQTGKAEIFAGLRVNTLELAVDAGGWMTAKASVIGMSSGGIIALSGTPAYTAAQLVQGSHGSTFAWHSHTPNMRGFRLMLNNNLIRRPYLGSLYTDAPTPGGFASVGLEVTLPWEDHDLYDDFRTGSSATATLSFTGTGNNALAIILNQFRITGVDKPVDRAGELVQTVRGFASDLPGTNQGLSIVVKNSNTTAI